MGLEGDPGEILIALADVFGLSVEKMAQRIDYNSSYAFLYSTLSEIL